MNSNLQRQGSRHIEDSIDESIQRLDELGDKVREKCELINYIVLAGCLRLQKIIKQERVNGNL